MSLNLDFSIVVKTLMKQKQEKKMELKGPFYEHDCSLCVYLGTILTDETIYDLYHCPKDDTVNARYSSDGPDYICSLREIKAINPICKIGWILKDTME